MRISSIEAIALIDANNFYASCEQNINPHLRNKPVVILSNNDGCIIARSPEARALKIKMGTPYFKVKERLNKLDVAVLSSNYSLYGDMSRRLMNLLKNYCEEIEIYSILHSSSLLNSLAFCSYHRKASSLSLRLLHLIYSIFL